MIIFSDYISFGDFRKKLVVDVNTARVSINYEDKIKYIEEKKRQMVYFEPHQYIYLLGNNHS